MAWIKIDHTTLDKPEVMQIAERLSITPEQAFGHLCRVWIWADQQSLNGHAVSVTEKGIDRVSCHADFAAAMRETGWLRGRDGALTFPNFGVHNGETAKKRALAYKRQVTHRSRSERDISVTRVREEKDKKEKHSSFVLPDWVPQEPWLAWLEVRSKKKVPNTERALAMAVNELQRLKDAGNDPRAVLEAATLKGWRGLFPVVQEAAHKHTERKTCAYCDSPATGRVNQIDHCRAHSLDAMDEKPRKSA